MKKNKRNKFLGLLLATLMLVSSFSTVAFAAEADNSNGIPEGATVHTIEVTVPAASEDNIDGSGASTRMWGQQSPSVGAGSTVTTSSFSVPERYFAFECSATKTDGSATSGTYKVAAMISSAEKSANVGYADGTVYKNDWIDFGKTENTTYFKITNYSSYALKVSLTYYSWS